RFAPPFTHRYLTFSFRYPAHGSSVGTDESSIVTFRYRAILCDGCAYACGFAAGTLMPLYGERTPCILIHWDSLPLLFPQSSKLVSPSPPRFRLKASRRRWPGTISWFLR